jgi:hypothetical protein
MSRIQKTFAALAAQQKKGLIPFITAGDPDPALTVDLMHALVAGGADVIELGVPFSDPMADGPVIQRASERALAQGVSLSSAGLGDRVPQDDATTPVVLMGYANPIERMGEDASPGGQRGRRGRRARGRLPARGVRVFRRADAREPDGSDLPAGADLDRRPHRRGGEGGQRLSVLRVAHRRDWLGHARPRAWLRVCR